MDTRWQVVLGIVAVLVPARGVAAQAGDPVALLTEIKAGRGEVRVKAAGEADWKVSLPFLSLRPGDQIQATQDATAVVMFTRGQGTLTVTAANSPARIQAPPPSPSGGSIQGLVANLTQLLLGRKKELTYVPLAVRSAKQPPLLLSPREGKLLGPPTFVWAGSHPARYTVRVLDLRGVVWEQANLIRRPLAYPDTAPALRPGVPYRWELATEGFPPQQGRFSLLPPGEVTAVRETLKALDSTGLPGYPQSTLALMRAEFLLDRNLFTEAQRELQAAIATDPDEPSLHVMLGTLHERVGLPELAAEAFDEAQFLVTR